MKEFARSEVLGVATQAGGGVFSSRGGSGRKKLTRKPTPKTRSPVTPAAKATLAGVTAAVPDSKGAMTPVVRNAAEVPIIRPPTFVAKAPPVPRRWTGKTLGRYSPK